MVKPIDRFERRRRRTRHALKVNGGGRPRLSVFRSGRHIYGQVIDDVAGHTLASACTLDKSFRGEGDEAKGKTGSDVDAAKRVGMLLAERAKAAGVERVVFDRGGYKYHGRVKALADGAREGGLSF